MIIRAEGKNTMLSIGEVLFYFFWIVMSFSKGMGWYEGMLAYNLCLVFSMSCICLKIILEKHTFFELSAIAFLVIIGGMVYLRSGEKAPLIYIFLVIGMKDIPVKRVFQLGLFVWSVCFGYRAFIEISGISKGLVFAHEKLGLGAILRWGFGYPHPNVMHITYAVIAAFILYLTNRKGRELFKLLVILFIGNCIVFFYSISYTGFLLTTACLLIFLYFDSRKQFSRIEKYTAAAIFPLCIFFSIFAPLLTGKGAILEKYGEFFNNLFNSRFHATRLFLQTGITLFGDRIDLGGWALDSSYVSLLVRNGLVFFLIVVIAYFFLILYCIQKAEWKKLALILSFCIAGISEPFLFNTSFKNLIFVFLGEYFYLLLNDRFNRKEKSTFTDSRWVEKKIWVPIQYVSEISQKIRRILSRCRRKLTLYGLIGGLLFAVLYVFIVPVPKSIYVGKGNTDCAAQEEKYIDKDNLPENFDSVIYEYQGPDSPLYEFRGNLLYLEQIRGIIGWGIIGYFCVNMFVIVFWTIKINFLNRSENIAKV